MPLTFSRCNKETRAVNQTAFIDFNDPSVSDSKWFSFDGSIKSPIPSTN